MYDAWIKLLDMGYVLTYYREVNRLTNNVDNIENFVALWNSFCTIPIFFDIHKREVCEFVELLRKTCATDVKTPLVYSSILPEKRCCIIN